MGKSNFGKLLGVGAGIALGAYLMREYMKRKQTYDGSFSPLIDSVKVVTDGVLTNLWTFRWDDEEHCKRATEEKLNSRGEVTMKTSLVFDFQEYQIVIRKYINDESVPSETTYLSLNDFDVVTSIVTHSKEGGEQSWQLDINGAELSQIMSEEETAKMYWHDGNLEGISYFEEVRQKMTYYKDKENYIFPDINLFANGFSLDMLTTYLVGVRSRYFLRTMSITGANYHQQSQLSYLLDNFDRPIQVLVEQTEVSDTITTNSSKEFEIKYKRI